MKIRIRQGRVKVMIECAFTLASRLSVLLTIWLSVSTIVSAAPEGNTATRNDQFERITPEEAGYSSQKLAKLVAYLKNKNSSSMMLLYDGKVFFEWGDIYQKHTIHSMRKPLMSALFGTLFDQGKLDLGLTLKALDVQDSPSPLTEVERSATLEMLLKSRSGIYHDAVAESEWMKNTKPKRGSHKPGEAYYYNNWSFNYAGFLYEQISGKNIYDAFYQKIAKPLGMLQFKGKFTSVNSETDQSIPQVDGFYDFDRRVSKYPAYHFRMSSHDLALFCQLYLNRGSWKGKQIISEEWIEKSTQPYSITNQKYNLAYGMFWAVLTQAEDEQNHHSFYHAGAGVHMIGVYPKHKLVMVHRVDTEKPDYTFKNDDLYPVIRMMHGARIK